MYLSTISTILIELLARFEFHLRGLEGGRGDQNEFVAIFTQLNRWGDSICSFTGDQADA